MKNVSISLILLFFFSHSFAQVNVCSFDEQMAKYQQQDPVGYAMSRAAHVEAVKQYRATHPGINHYPNPNPSGNSNALVGGTACDSAKYVLPVVVHVIHDPADTLGAGSHISVAQVENQLEELNRAFSNYYFPKGDSSVNTGIRFCLAQTKPDGTSFSGINYVSSTQSNHPRWAADSLRALAHYPTSQYINIYVVNTILDSNGTNYGVLGYANYPQYGSRINDVIVVRHDWFGKYNGTLFPALQSASEGKVLAHEMGHYLGLFHPFEGGCIGLDSTDCATKGDMCCDVPAVSSGIVGGCNGANTCDERYGDLPDQRENYMDYSAPSCKNTFTADQAEVMYTTLEGVRSSLWQPTNINTLNLACCFNSAIFSGYTDGCSVDSINLEAYDYDTSARYTWKLYKHNGPTLTSIYTGIPTYGLVLDSGMYDIELTVAIGAKTFSKRINNAMTIYKCDSLLPSTHGSWYFGVNAGIRFYANGLVLKDDGPYINTFGQNQINAQGPTMSLCRPNGDLLFYGGVENKGAAYNTDLRIFDGEYKEMLGSPLKGGNSLGQTTIGLPVYGSDSLYMVFHSTFRNEAVPNSKFYYSIIDISKTATTQGEIIDKNKEIYNPQVTGSSGEQITEGLSLVKHCDSTKKWLILPMHVTNSSGQTSAYFATYIIDSDTIIYDTIQSIPYEPEIFTNVIASPNGRYLSYDLQLFSFNNSTGKIDFISVDSSYLLSHAYGASFSPNSKLLYRVSYYHDPDKLVYDTAHTFFLEQIDLSSSNPFLTKKTISETIYHKMIQLGPDNSIYLSPVSSTYLSSMVNPNVLDQGNNEVGYELRGVELIKNGIGGMSNFGLPNFDITLRTSKDSLTFDMRSQSCFTRIFSPNDLCRSSYTWYFGDGTTSSNIESEHTYSGSGLYTVTLVSEGDTARMSVYIGIREEDKAIWGTTVFCSSNTPVDYSVKYNSSFAYAWLATGAVSMSSNHKHRTEVAWQDSGMLQVIITDNRTECTDTNKIKVYKRDYVDLDFDFESSNCALFHFKTSHFCDTTYTWDFGDGSNSTIQNPSHVFDTAGEYTVTLSANGDSVSRTILVGLGGNDLLITGDTINCDDSTLFSYNVSENPNFIFEWFAEGTSSFSSAEHEASAVWDRSGSISVIIFNSSNGCTDTNTIAVNKMRPDSIIFTSVITNCTDVQFETSDYCGLDKAWDFGDGTSSTLQNHSHSYASRGSYKVTLCVDGDTVSQWLHLQNNILPVLEGPSFICEPSVAYDFNLNNYTTGATYVWSAVNGSVSNPNGQLEAKVQFNTSGEVAVEASNDIGCKDTISIVVEQKPTLVNTISSNTPHCYPDSNSFILGNPPQGGNGTYDFQWYSSLNNSNFTAIPNDTGMHHYLLTKLNPVPYLRREVKSGDCESVSNSVQTGVPYYANEISIVDTPCFSGGTINLAGSEVGSSFLIEYKWEKSFDSIQWYGDIDLLNVSSRINFRTYSTTVDSSTVYFRRQIYGTYGIVPECRSLSNVIKVTPQVSITQQPQDKLFCEPDASTLVFGISLQDGSTGITTVRAEIRSENGSGYTDLGLVSGNSFTYTPSNPSNYTGVDTFRFRISTSCGVFYSRKAIIDTYSKGDIWFRDSYLDDGSEPNEDSSHYDIVRSPDIWNRQMPDNMSAHQNMEFKNNSPNQLNLWVRNRGNEATEPTNLYLYWTLGSINNEEWDIRWLDTTGNQIWNASLGDYFPMGSRINNQNDPIVVPSIPPNSSTKISYDWYPPNPAWFEGLVPDDSRGVSICLLARLEHCEVYPHKMAIDEIFDQHVKINAINNNNIITKNTWVIDGDSSNLVDRDNDGDIDYTGGSWTGMGRQKDPSWFTKFCFDELSPSFFAHWNVAFEVPDVVRDAILANINYNPNVTYLGDNIFKFDEGANGNKCITQMILPDNELFFFRPLFFPANGWENLPPEVFEVGVAQYTSSGYVEGAGSFLLDNTDLALNNIEYVNTQNNSGEESNHLIVSPNPTNNVFSIELDEETKLNLLGETGTLIVADAYGYTHVILPNISSQSLTTINLGGYQAGMYNVRFEIGGQVFYKYVVKTDE